MLFNSFDFLIYFPLVVGVYFIIPHKWRWAWLLGASYYFYMAWNPRYLFLIVFSTLVDYFAAILMHNSKSQKTRKRFLILSLVSNVGLLFTFKYLNLFGQSFDRVFEMLNFPLDVPYVDLLLPVGISFYTFQTLSYTIDVYRGDREPEYHLGIFALYVTFFPQLVAGPIERSTRLIPQFYEKYQFDFARVADGLQLMLWGFFKKVVIADRAALIVAPVYQNPQAYEGFTFWVTNFCFAFQLYCDFSGYSDIAIGGARVMGFDLMENFRRPFLARDFVEFWTRWHISLMTWFVDYIYKPLGGGRGKPARVIFNTMVIFTISGFWHGANWTFFIWGLTCGIHVIVSRMVDGKRKTLLRVTRLNRFPKISHLILAVLHFLTFVNLHAPLFVAHNIGDSIYVYGELINISQFNLDFATITWLREFIPLMLGIFILMSVEVVQEFGAPQLEKRPLPVRWAAYYGMIFMIAVLGVFQQQPFVYFQF